MSCNFFWFFTIHILTHKPLNKNPTSFKNSWRIVNFPKLEYVEYIYCTVLYIQVQSHILKHHHHYGFLIVNDFSIPRKSSNLQCSYLILELKFESRERCKLAKEIVFHLRSLTSSYVVELKIVKQVSRLISLLMHLFDLETRESVYITIHLSFQELTSSLEQEGKLD